MKQGNDKSIAILLLAAGASRRMGQPKQLLKINAQHTLIEHTIAAAQTSACQQLAVVLGANAALIQSVITPTGIATVVNKQWEKGMGTSLQVGLRFLLQAFPTLSALIISVCDQPYLTSAIFDQLIMTYQHTKAPIISANYGKRLGVPALLDKQFFPQLLALEDDEGARKIIRGNLSLVKTVDFPKGAIDLDTPAAYQEYRSKEQGKK